MASVFSSKLRKASYQGISFEVVAGTITFGRRLVTHEYPQRDFPYTEDLGRSARKFSLTAFIVGDDYLQKAKKLIEAFEKDHQDTPGTLVHPWLGTLKVYPNEKPTVAWDTSKRLAKITLSFIEGGELNNPTISLNLGSLLKDAVDNFIDNTLDTFVLSMEDINGYTELVENIANGSFLDITGALSDSNLSKLFNLGDAVTDLVSVGTSLLNKGFSEFAQSVLSTLGVGSLSQSIRDFSSTTADLLKDLKEPTLTNYYKSISKDVSNEGISSSLLNLSVSAENRANLAVESLFRRIMLSNVIGTSSMIGDIYDVTDEQSYASDTSIRSYSQVLAIRDNLLEQIEQEMLMVGDDEENIYDSLSDLYRLTYQNLTTNVLADNNSVDLEIKTPTNAFVLAYDMYEDATRVDEITTRNDLVNPLFVPTKTIKVLNN